MSVQGIPEDLLRPKLPNRRVFGALNAIGIMLMTLAITSIVGLVGWMVVETLTRNPYQLDRTSHFSWSYVWMAAGVGVVGLVLWVWPGWIFRKYYRHVHSGIIINKWTSGGGRTTLSWHVTLKGYTLAGELRTWKHEIDAGWWHQYRIGDNMTID